MLSIAPDYYEVIYTKAEILCAVKKPQEAIEILNTIPDELKNKREFLYISMISYYTLAQLEPTRYNIEKAMEYNNELTNKYSSESKVADIKTKLYKLIEQVQKDN